MRETMSGLRRSFPPAWTRSALVVAFTMVLISSLTSTSWAQRRYETLDRFTQTSGTSPLAGLVTDLQGNLYGTTSAGGAHDVGTVFELTPDGHGGWNETVLHSFNAFIDGASPLAGLIFDAAGNLYGTAEAGGAHGFGIVFELAPDGHGGWQGTVLHSFKDRPGALPEAGLMFGRSGHLYGTTLGDLQTTFGSVFEIVP